MRRFSVADGTRNPSFSAGLHEFFDSGSIERDDLGGFADWVFNWLRDNAELLKASQDDAAGDLFGKILCAITNFDGMHATTLALAQARRELAVSKAQLEQRSRPSRSRSFLFRLLRVLLTSKWY